MENKAKLKNQFEAELLDSFENTPTKQLKENSMVDNMMSAVKEKNIKTEQALLPKNNTRVISCSFKNAKYDHDAMIPIIQSKANNKNAIYKYQFYLDEDLSNLFSSFMRKNKLKPSEAIKYILSDFFKVK